MQSILFPELHLACNSKVSSANEKKSLEFEMILHGKQLTEDNINEIFKFRGILSKRKLWRDTKTCKQIVC